MTSARPLLLFDGDCAFCRYWVRYWERLTGSRVDYRPFQSVLAARPDLDPAACRAAVRLELPDGRCQTGAAASFTVLAFGGAGLGAALYARSRLFARVAESAYAGIAHHREAAGQVARALWGPERMPATYRTAGAAFARVLGLIYATAFFSLGTQVRGLLGSDGILPVDAFLAAAARADPTWHAWRWPSVFWLNHSDDTLVAVCMVGTVSGVLAALVRRRGALLAVCYALYLSIFAVGQDFLGFQWDLLLLEAGFLAPWIGAGSALLSWLYRLLLFRFMFLAGCVKLLSGDPHWASLRALEFHFETQPLPTPLAWYAHHAPAPLLEACVAAMFVVELLLPLLIFAPRRPRMLAAGGIILLEILIALTGNYTFFNFLTLALTLFLFDDAQWSRVVPVPRTPPRALRLATAALAALLAVQNAYYVLRPLLPGAMPRALAAFAAACAPLRMVNAYGVFAVMTTTRPEIEIQGSDDGRTWRSYALPFKPGDPAGPLRWNAPHQPRLDWQLWFAALGGADEAPWFGNLLGRLLQGSPSVVRLFAINPFPAAPPHAVRALLWEYRYTTAAERAATGAIWVRTPLGMYYPALRRR